MATLALHRFRDGKAGVVWVETIAGMRELILDEHELVLGHERGDTAAPGVPEAERHVFTGGCMEHPVAAVPGTGTGGASTGKTGVPLSGGEAQRRSHLPCYLNMALARKSPALETPVAESKRLCRMVRIQEGGEQDIRESPRPAAAGRPLKPRTASELKKRIKKRVGAYRRDGKQLLELMLHGTVSIVPEPRDRIAIATIIHKRAGHFGKRRTKCHAQGTLSSAGLVRSVNKASLKRDACGQLKAGFSTASAPLHPISTEGLFIR